MRTGRCAVRREHISVCARITLHSYLEAQTGVHRKSTSLVRNRSFYPVAQTGVHRAGRMPATPLLVMLARCCYSKYYRTCTTVLHTGTSTTAISECQELAQYPPARAVPSPHRLTASPPQQRSLPRTCATLNGKVA